MKIGTSSPDSIDLVVRNARTDTWSLVVTEPGPWDGSEGRLDRLERKLFRYREYLVRGELYRRHPESKAKPVFIEVHFYCEPTTPALALIESVRDRFVPYDIPVVVQRMGWRAPS